MNENYWYENRHELEEGMIFQTANGLVMLDRSVPGDGTKWYVADRCNEVWSYCDSTIEPGDLMGQPLTLAPSSPKP